MSLHEVHYHKSLTKLPHQVIFFQPTLLLGVLFAFCLENAAGGLFECFCLFVCFVLLCFDQRLKEKRNRMLFGIMELFINNTYALICMEIHIALKLYKYPAQSSCSKN